jgi:mono/diheme cytochrome c family protein
MTTFQLRPLLLAALGAASVARADLPEPTFERDVRPILKKHCFHCHGEGEKLKGGVDLRLRRFMLKEDEDGNPVLAPGHPEQSELIRLVREGEMPAKGDKLRPAEIELLEQWVAAGAKTARPEPEQVPKFFITEEEREFWAFQPITRPAVPAVKNAARVRTPIDAFLLAKLEAQKLSFNPDADKPTLLRRLMLDLTGLPPTPEEIALFLADETPDAYERLVERVLASPHYGERWGRHWLDVAGYADSDGYTDTDPVRPWAYKFRDYVIRSINADKPFDQFIREQLAGDEMVKPPLKNLGPDAIEKLTATGFLRMAPDGTASADAATQKVARNAVVSETLKVVSSSLLGLTVGCAQCHDHRYDPIPQTDYYRLRAIFEPALDPEQWRVPAARLVSLMSDADRAKAAEIEKEAKTVDEERAKKEAEFIEKVLGWELEKKPEEVREPLRDAFQTEAKKRTPEQLKLLKEHPTINQLSGGSLYLYDRTYHTKHAEELKKIADRAAEVRKRKPFEEFVPALTEVPAPKLPSTFLFSRGDPTQPREQVGPGELMILASLRPTDFPPKAPALPTSGRRLAFAQSLTDGHHPLTTRVLVNRVWHEHFGHGIVGSLADFGSLGERPTHPELLDWLASEFVAEGWSLKKLHRLIVNSTAYRQSSAREPAKERLDPDNHLLGRMNVRRIEAETIRDAMLVASGKFNPKMFGAPVPIMADEDGQIIVGVDTTDTAGRPSGKFVPLNGEEFRRSLYIQMRRSKPIGMLETFDLPRMEPNCELRNASTVAPQSLAMMNGDFTLTQSKYLAERLTHDAGTDAEAQVKRAWLLAFGSDPSLTEMKESVEFLTRQTAFFKEHPVKIAAPAKGKEAPPAEPPMQALATFCQALLTSNHFLYAD